MIPEEVTFKGIHAMALACPSESTSDADIAALGILKEISEKFVPQLYLVHVEQNAWSMPLEADNEPIRLQKELAAYKTTYSYVGGADIVPTLNDFVDTHHADMLVLLPHHHSFLEEWFGKSVTRNALFDMHTPLLLLRGNPSV
ncbi:MAG: universal stress protein [Bacteroidetes bacterium]|nr:universal stress protein [Bacteroidota bacterium]